MSEIRIAIAGVGNCTSSLVQGPYYYKDVKESDRFIPGLMHPVMGGYKVADIVPVVAFDVDARKVGKIENRRRKINPSINEEMTSVKNRNKKILV